jgi:glycosyltransferase involved in cell wall biosynthesis
MLKAFSTFKKWQQSTMQLILLPKHEIVPLKIIDKMATYKYRDDVQMLDGLSEKEKASLFGGAYAIIHIPVNDADLLPVVEALHCGVPVIAAAGSESIKEYGTATGIQVPAADFELIGDAIINIFKNEDEKTRMADNAKQQAAAISRDEIAKTFWELVEKAAKS